MEVEDELMGEFLADRVELFELVDETLLFLERHPDDVPALHSVFRSVHTMKGTAGMLGLGPLEALFQRGEDLLGSVRDGDTRFDAPIAALLFDIVDCARAGFDRLEASGQMDPLEADNLLARVDVVLLGA